MQSINTQPFVLTQASTSSLSKLRIFNLIKGSHYFLKITNCTAINQFW